MHNQAHRTYLEHRILNASPEQLQLLLYEGAIRFAQSARSALVDADFEKAQNGFERAGAVLIELLAGLRPDVDADLCDRYAQLYNFCLRRLNEANFRHDVGAVDDALAVLKHLRETWVEVLERIAEDRAAAAKAEPLAAAAS